VSRTTRVTAFSLVLLAGACAGPTSTISVPDKLKPAMTESLSMIVRAQGVQIYECRAKKDQPGGYEWAFVAPEADLFDARGNKIGKHYAGPHWESTDGSKILGTVKERANAPTSDAIPVATVGREVRRSGRLVQQGHEHPAREYRWRCRSATGCSQADAGKPARINYTADYYFFTPR
jgi:hypothetical protein